MSSGRRTLNRVPDFYNFVIKEIHKVIATKWYGYTGINMIFSQSSNGVKQVPRIVFIFVY